MQVSERLVFGLVLRFVTKAAVEAGDGSAEGMLTLLGLSVLTCLLRAIVLMLVSFCVSYRT
jgi:hypothetical protein